MVSSPDSLRKTIEAHIEQHIGAIKNVYCESAQDTQEVCIVHVPPSDTRPVHTLVTCGISRRAMRVPKADLPAYLELMMTLPREWQLEGEQAQEERWSWPLRLLRRLARHAHEESGWLGWGRMIPNGDPPLPYARTTNLSVALIVPSLLVPTAFYELKAAAKSTVFYAVVPLYKEEYELGRARGTDTLFTRLIDGNVNDLVESKRRNVARRRFWLFG